MGKAANGKKVPDRGLRDAPMWLRSSDIIIPETAREVSGRAEGRTPGARLESSRLAARYPKFARLSIAAGAG